MKVYRIPPDTNEKEKVIGGVFTLNQFFWMIGGVILGAVVSVSIYLLGNSTLALFLGGLMALTGLPFALYKKEGLSLFEYIRRKRKFKKKTYLLPNIRKGVE